MSSCLETIFATWGRPRADDRITLGVMDATAWALVSNLDAFSDFFEEVGDYTDITIGHDLARLIDNVEEAGERAILAQVYADAVVHVYAAWQRGETEFISVVRACGPIDHER